MGGGRRATTSVLNQRKGIAGYLVWQVGKWYLKQRLRSKRAEVMSRLPSRRTSLAIGVGAIGALVATAVIGRRLSG